MLLSVNESDPGLRAGLHPLHHSVFLGTVLAQVKQQPPLQLLLRISSEARVSQRTFPPLYEQQLFQFGG